MWIRRGKGEEGRGKREGERGKSKRKAESDVRHHVLTAASRSPLPASRFPLPASLFPLPSSPFPLFLFPLPLLPVPLLPHHVDCTNQPVRRMTPVRLRGALRGSGVAGADRVDDRVVL